MYEEEERRSFPLKDFLLKLILIIIFVLLLVWLLPIPDLTGLNNKIFSANVNEMKDAAISYFTTERLPQKEGESVTLTLQQMFDMKLLLPFKDKDGKTCDTKASYVQLTKKATEYEMKVYLKCNEEEDYIIVHLGCYSYCESAICEKEEKEEKEEKPVVSTGPSCKLTISNGKLGKNGWYIGDVTVSFKSKTTTTEGAKIVSYGMGTKTNYDGKSSYKVTKDGTTKVYGYVKDSKGKTAVCSVVVKKDTTKPSCSLGVLSGTKNSDGNYITNVSVGFTSKTDKTSGINTYGVTNSSKVNYNKKTSYLVTNNGETKVYGYVKDKAGNTAVCNLSVNKVKVEEDKISEPSCSLEITSGTKGDNNWYTSNVVVGFKSKKTTNGATITSYGIGTKTNYDNKNTYTLAENGIKNIYGYVKDSKGNTAICSISVKKDAIKPSCELDIQNGTYNSNGYYTSNVTIGFKSKSDATSGMNSFGIGKSTTYSNNATYKLTTTGTHTINGYVKDNAGNTNVCSIKVVKKDITYEYEYLKTWNNSYSNWSDWTTKEYDPSNPPKFGTTNTQITENLGSSKVAAGYTYKAGAPIYGKLLKHVATITEKVCSGYNYYRTSTTSTTTYAIKESSQWTYLKTITLKEQPTDTLSVKYEFAGFNWSKCDNTCTSTPYMLFKVYTRDVSVVDSKNETITTPTGIKVTCASYETKESYIYYNYTTVIGYEEIREEKFKTVYKYRYKTRKLLQAAGKDIKWSSIANNSDLINQGYKMTGNKRVKG